MYIIHTQYIPYIYSIVVNKIYWNNSSDQWLYNWSEQQPLTSATKLFMASRADKAFTFNYNINVVGQKGWLNLAPGGLVE